MHMFVNLLCGRLFQPVLKGADVATFEKEVSIQIIEFTKLRDEHRKLRSEKTGYHGHHWPYWNQPPASAMATEAEEFYTAFWDDNEVRVHALGIVCEVDKVQFSLQQGAHLETYGFRFSSRKSRWLTTDLGSSDHDVLLRRMRMLLTYLSALGEPISPPRMTPSPPPHCAWACSLSECSNIYGFNFYSPVASGTYRSTVS